MVYILVILLFVLKTIYCFEEDEIKVISYNQTDLKEMYEIFGKFESPRVDFGCENRITLGIKKISTRGVDLCSQIECNNVGNNPKADNFNSLCEYVDIYKASINTTRHSGYETTYEIKCNCPHFGNTVAPNCSNKLNIDFKSVEKKLNFDCYMNQDKCIGGKYCRPSADRLRLPCEETCILSRLKYNHRINLIVYHDCCKKD